MHDLLTAAEYAAIAKTMSFPANAFINGSFRPAASGRTFKTFNPATGQGQRGI
jgi:gamma-glutamyl-gamma-aminobutyraldehyde dehydrogenase